MAQNIDIRKAQPTDAVGIAVVRAYTWLTAYKGLLPDSVLTDRIDAVPANAQRIKGLIENGASNYAVAVCDGTVIGFVNWGRSRNDDFPGGEINAFYMLKGWAGKGTGRKLFEYAVAQLKKDGYKTMIVNCLEGNPSVEIYKHLGGKVAGVREDDVFGYMTKENILQFEI